MAITKDSGAFVMCDSGEGARKMGCHCDNASGVPMTPSNLVALGTPLRAIADALG